GPEPLRGPRGGTPAHEAGEFGHSGRVPRARRGAREHGRKKRLRPGNAAPRREYVPWRLEFPRARRMIGRDEVDLSLEQRAPQAVAVAGVADRRRALERRAMPGQIVIVEGPAG